jgi:hypothetical protein
VQELVRLDGGLPRKRGFLGSRAVRAMLWSERQPCSGCGPSRSRAELTLASIKRSLILATAERTAVSYER